jgi:methylmalonyl-CoA mutase
MWNFISTSTIPLLNRLLFRQKSKISFRNFRSNREYDAINEQCAIAPRYINDGVTRELASAEGLSDLKKRYETKFMRNVKLIAEWSSLKEQYSKRIFEYTVRDKTIRQPLTTTSLR